MVTLVKHQKCNLTLTRGTIVIMPTQFDKMLKDMWESYYNYDLHKLPVPPRSTYSVIESSTSMKASSDSATQKHSSTSDSEGMMLFVDLPGVSPDCVTVSATWSQVWVHVNTPEKKGTYKYTISSEFYPRGAIASMAHGRLTVKMARTDRADAPSPIPITVKLGPVHG